MLKVVHSTGSGNGQNIMRRGALSSGFQTTLFRRRVATEIGRLRFRLPLQGIKMRAQVIAS